MHAPHQDRDRYHHLESSAKSLYPILIPHSPEATTILTLNITD